MSGPFPATQELTLGPQMKTVDSGSPPREAPTTGARQSPISGGSGNAVFVGRRFPLPEAKGAGVGAGPKRITCKYRGACNKRRISSYSHGCICLGKGLRIHPSGKRMERAGFPSV